MSDDFVLDWLEPHDGNLVGRLSQLTDPARITDELYFSVSARTPDDEELAESKSYLDSHHFDRVTVIGRLAWALLASAEFSVDH